MSTWRNMKLYYRLLYLVLFFALVTILISFYVRYEPLEITSLFGNNNNDGKHFIDFKSNCWKSQSAKANMHMTDLLDNVEDSMKLYSGSYPGAGDGNVDVSKLPQKSGQPLTVIVMPHSHNDPNWIRSYKEYYNEQTSEILKFMVRYLTQWKNMTFVWTESVFLETWWSTATEADKKALKALIQDKRLEVTSGGWVAPDEASTHVYGLVDQLVEGHLWLLDHLGFVPQTWWNIDPFGYSLASSFLSAKSGFKQSVILRVSDPIKAILRQNKSLEFFWRNFWDDAGGRDLSVKSSSLTSVLPFMLYNHKFSCGPHPLICLHFDFREVPGEYTESQSDTVTSKNVHQLAELLFQQLEMKSRLYRHNVLLYPLGDDFRWDREIEWHQQYTNFNKLMRYMNAHSKWKIQLRWGTVSDYFAEVARQTKAFPTFIGDFFVYTDRDEVYWSGYFTTRPMLKRWSREVQNKLRMAEIYFALAVTQKYGSSLFALFSKERLFKHLQFARRDYALFQHHDSITGTSPDKVANTEYVRMLSSAMRHADRVLSESTAALFDVGESDRQVDDSDLLLISNYQRPAAQQYRLTYQVARKLVLNQAYEYVVINPVAQWREDCTFAVYLRNQYVRVEYADELGEVEMQRVKCQVNPWFERGRLSEKHFEVTACVNVPPLGSRVIRVVAESSSSPLNRICTLARVSMNYQHNSAKWRLLSLEEQSQRRASFQLDVSWGGAVFNATSGLLMSYFSKMLGGDISSLSLSVDLGLTASGRGLQGAYIMDISNWELRKDGFFEHNSVMVMEGPVLARVRVSQYPFNHSVTLYQASFGTFLAGVLHVHNEVTMSENVQNSNLVMRLLSSINSGVNFYTDSNDMALMRRKRRSLFSIAANYYPMSSVVMLEDNLIRLNVLAGQSHGVTSCEEGGLDIMLHRVFNSDDQRGMGSGIVEDFAAESDFFVLPERRNEPLSAQQSKDGAFLSAAALFASRCSTYPLIVARVRAAPSSANWLRRHFSPLLALGQEDSPFPCDVDLLTLRSLNSTALTHFDALLIIQRAATACEFSSTLKTCQSGGRGVRLRQLFAKTEVIAARETTLTGVTPLRELSSTDQLLAFNAPDLRTYLLRMARRSAS